MVEDPPDHVPRRVLVVEDEFFIAMELEANLRDRGFEVIGPALSVEAALMLLQSHRPDAAVLDVNLQGEKVTPVARRLVALNIPFVLASAYAASDLATEAVLAGALNVGKPTDLNRLFAALEGLHVPPSS